MITSLVSEAEVNRWQYYKKTTATSRW